MHEPNFVSMKIDKKKTKCFRLKQWHVEEPKIQIVMANNNSFYEPLRFFSLRFYFHFIYNIKIFSPLLHLNTKKVRCEHIDHWLLKGRESTYNLHLFVVVFVLAFIFRFCFCFGHNLTDCTCCFVNVIGRQVV